MTQDERWMFRYNGVKSFIEENHRNPSKYNPEETDGLFPEKRAKIDEWKGNAGTEMEQVQRVVGIVRSIQAR